MTVENYNIPSRNTVYELYRFLGLYEHSIAKEVGNFDIENISLQKFIKEKDIQLKAVSKASYVKDMQRGNYIVFLYGDRKTGIDDKAHDLLRHIRNAIAHALVTKVAKNKRFLYMTDYNRKKTITMRANIDESLLLELINQVVDTKNK